MTTKSPKPAWSWTRLIELPFCLYAWLITVLIVAVTLIAMLILPTARLRERFASFVCRLLFVLTGCRPAIEGLKNLPDAHCVVVANHASYVDGPLMKGYLPSRFSFVIKGEMRDVPLVHFVLRRSGSRFVERFRANESSRDARQIVRAAQNGASLTFFPEGTFRLEPGVGRFRAGAFMAAAKSGMPIVPVAITGTREMLTCGDWMLRPSTIRIRILPPIGPEHPDYNDTKRLAEVARQAILERLDEPDLLDADTSVAEPIA